VDVALARVGIESERTDEPVADGEGTLYAPHTLDNRVEGDFGDRARGFSLYTWMETHPNAKRLALGGALAGAALLLARRSGGTGARRGGIAPLGRRTGPEVADRMPVGY
jgi:hypothetical protein